jgi:hypothetical protein
MTNEIAQNDRNWYPPGPINGDERGGGNRFREIAEFVGVYAFPAYSKSPTSKSKRNSRNDPDCGGASIIPLQEIHRAGSIPASALRKKSTCDFWGACFAVESYMIFAGWGMSFLRGETK